jgi:hypothetical protein
MNKILKVAVNSIIVFGLTKVVLSEVEKRREKKKIIVIKNNYSETEA